jgi:hypothetical protein
MVLEYVGNGLHGLESVMLYMCKRRGWIWVLKDLDKVLSGLEGYIHWTRILWYWSGLGKFHRVQVLFSLCFVGEHLVAAIIFQPWSKVPTIRAVRVLCFHSFSFLCRMTLVPGGAILGCC